MHVEGIPEDIQRKVAREIRNLAWPLKIFPSTEEEALKMVNVFLGQYGIVATEVMLDHKEREVIVMNYRMPGNIHEFVVDARLEI